MTDDATPREVGSHAGLGLEPERCVSPSVIADVMLGSPGMRRAIETLRAADQAALLLAGRAVWDAAVAAERERCAKLPRLPTPRVLASGTIAGKAIELRGWHTDDIEIWERQHGLKFEA